MAAEMDKPQIPHKDTVNLDMHAQICIIIIRDAGQRKIPQLPHRDQILVIQRIFLSNAGMPCILCNDIDFQVFMTQRGKEFPFLPCVEMDDPYLCISFLHIADHLLHPAFCQAKGDFFMRRIKPACSYRIQ